MCCFVTTHTTSHTHAHTVLSHLPQGRQAVATYLQTAQTQKVRAEHLLLQGLTQWVLWVELNIFHSVTLLWSYRGAEELQLPNTNLMFLIFFSFFSTHLGCKLSSSPVNYSGYLSFTDKKDTSIISCPTLAQQNWFLFYEELDPESGMSLLLFFVSCGPDSTYYFEAALFIQQCPLNFICVGKFYRCKVGYETEN